MFGRTNAGSAVHILTAAAAFTSHCSAVLLSLGSLPCQAGVLTQPRFMAFGMSVPHYLGGVYSFVS